MNGNVNSIEYIMSICDAGTVELLRLRTLYYLNNVHLFVCLLFAFFMTGISGRITVSHGCGS